MLQKFNRWLAVKITKGMSTMWCAYIFLLWSLIPLVWPAAQSVVFYVSGGIIQLVALSIIMVGQKVIGETREKQVRETHDTIIETHEMIIEELLIIGHEELYDLKLQSIDRRTKIQND